jgi:microcystin-dependent protein
MKDKIEQLRNQVTITAALISRQGDLPPEVRERVVSALDRWARYFDITGVLPDQSGQTDFLLSVILREREYFEERLPILRAQAASDDLEIINTAYAMDERLSMALDTLRGELAMASRAEQPNAPEQEGFRVVTLDIFAGAHAVVNDLTRDIEQARLEDRFFNEMGAVRAKAEAALSDATRVSRAAQTLVGEAGAATEAKEIGAYAERQLRAAEFFRWATVVLIGGTVLAALLVPHPEPGDVTGTIYRIAVLAGVAGLATYMGRQAAVHRRAGSWARALQVQLRTFPALMLITDDEKTRARVFETFANRVLGAPPEGSKAPADDGPAMQAILEALVRRTQ